MYIWTVLIRTVLYIKPLNDITVMNKELLTVTLFDLLNSVKKIINKNRWMWCMWPRVPYQNLSIHETIQQTLCFAELLQNSRTRTGVNSEQWSQPCIILLITVKTLI